MDDNSPSSGPTEKSKDDAQNQLPAINGDSIPKAGRGKLLPPFFRELITLGGIGTGIWVLGEHLSNQGHVGTGTFLNFIAFVCFFATVPLVLLKLWPHPKAIWWSFAGFSFLIFSIFIIASRKTPEPMPDFILSLKIGDSPDSKVFLTNDFLFTKYFVKVGDLPHGAVNLNALVKGVLAIPVQEGESSKVFTFIVESDAPVKVTDLEGIVGVPKQWKSGFDPKWHEVDEFLILPGAWKFGPTNMQYVAAQSPWTLFAYDSLSFPPITNPCTPEYIGNSLKGGLIEFCVRCTGFERMLTANVIFAPASSNFFKPFVTIGEVGPDGLLRLSIPPEKSQK